MGSRRRLLFRSGTLTGFRLLPNLQLPWQLRESPDILSLNPSYAQVSEAVSAAHNQELKLILAGIKGLIQLIMFSPVSLSRQLASFWGIASISEVLTSGSFS